MQLDLFGNTRQTPHERKPNSKELAIIHSTFGEEATIGICYFLNDIIELYPFKSFVRNSAGHQFLVIGASAEQSNMFYCIDETFSIYLQHQFSLFPDLNKHHEYDKKNS